jgi:hypothetical protein
MHDDETTMCWCGQAVETTGANKNGKRLFLGMVWCGSCLARLLRACPPKVMDAAWRRNEFEDC